MRSLYIKRRGLIQRRFRSRFTFLIRLKRCSPSQNTVLYPKRTAAKVPLSSFSLLDPSLDTYYHRPKSPDSESHSSIFFTLYFLSLHPHLHYYLHLCFIKRFNLRLKLTPGYSPVIIAQRHRPYVTSRLV